MTDYLARAMEQDTGDEREFTVEPDALTEGTALLRIFEKPQAKAAVSNDTHPAADEPASRSGKVSDPSGENGREAERPLAEALSALDRALGAVPAGKAVPEEGETAQSVWEIVPEDRPVRAAGAEAPESPALHVLERAMMRSPLSAGTAPAAQRSVPADAPVRETVPQGPDAALPLLDRVRRAQRGESFVHSERRAFTVTLPEPPAAAPAWTVEDLDRAVERDARRSGGDFRLY